MGGQTFGPLYAKTLLILAGPLESVQMEQGFVSPTSFMLIVLESSLVPLLLPTVRFFFLTFFLSFGSKCKL